MQKKNEAAHGWTKLIFGVVYIGILLAFAIQTWLLVDWLFPADQTWMKIIAVFTFDGCAALYTLVEMFYKFRLKKNKDLIQGMWWISFVLSGLATALEMYMSAQGRLAFTYDPHFIAAGYDLVTIAFLVQVVAMTLFVKREYTAFEEGVPTLDEQKKPGSSVPMQRPPMPSGVPAARPIPGGTSPLVTPRAQNGNN